jgi:uncharacterized membrane protein YdfJ with MMPL/SSD domain
VTSNGRIAALILGALLLVFGIWLIWTANAGWGAALFGLAIVAGTLFDRRYRGRPLPRAGSATAWQETGEREVDAQSGEVIAVWYDPATGARRYEPIGKSPS